MIEDKQLLLEHYRRTREALLAAIDGLTGEQLAEPSLDGWSVKDHLAHIAAWDELRAREIVRISAGHESAWRMGAAQDAEFGALMYVLRRGLALAQVRWELDSSRALVLEAVAAATPRGLDASLYGEAALRSRHEVEHTTWIRRWREALPGAR